MSDQLLRTKPQAISVPSKNDDYLLGNKTVLTNLLLTEKKYLPNPGYFEATQNDIVPDMRRQVTEWMLEVCEDKKCDIDVFPLAVSYMDRVLSSVCIFRKSFQQLATACMFIASKERQTDPLLAQELIYYADGAVDLSQLVAWELMILQVLEWNVATVTAHDFIPHLEKLLSANFSHILLKRVRQMAQSYIALLAQNHTLMALPPSIMASACMCSALRRCLDTSDPTLLPVQLFAEHIQQDKEDLLTHMQSVELHLSSVLEPAEILLSGLSGLSRPEQYDKLDTDNAGALVGIREMVECA